MGSLPYRLRAYHTPLYTPAYAVATPAFSFVYTLPPATAWLLTHTFTFYTFAVCVTRTHTVVHCCYLLVVWFCVYRVRVLRHSSRLPLDTHFAHVPRLRQLPVHLHAFTHAVYARFCRCGCGYTAGSRYAYLHYAATPHGLPPCTIPCPHCYGSPAAPPCGYAAFTVVGCLVRVLVVHYTTACTVCHARLRFAFTCTRITLRLPHYAVLHFRLRLVLRSSICRTRGCPVLPRLHWFLCGWLRTYAAAHACLGYGSGCRTARLRFTLRLVTTPGSLWTGCVATPRSGFCLFTLDLCTAVATTTTYTLPLLFTYLPPTFYLVLHTHWLFGSVHTHPFHTRSGSPAFFGSYTFGYACTIQFRILVYTHTHHICSCRGWFLVRCGCYTLFAVPRLHCVCWLRLFCYGSSAVTFARFTQVAVNVTHGYAVRAAVPATRVARFCCPVYTRIRILLLRTPRLHCVLWFWFRLHTLHSYVLGLLYTHYRLFWLRFFAIYAYAYRGYGCTVCTRFARCTHATFTLRCVRRCRTHAVRTFYTYWLPLRLHRTVYGLRRSRSPWLPLRCLPGSVGCSAAHLPLPLRFTVTATTVPRSVTPLLPVG